METAKKVWLYDDNRRGIEIIADKLFDSCKPAFILKEIVYNRLLLQNLDKIIRYFIGEVESTFEVEIDHESLILKYTGVLDAGLNPKFDNGVLKECLLEIANGTQQSQKDLLIGGSPVITKSETSERWTQIIMKPAFDELGMTCLEDDMIALLKRRVVDVVACCFRKEVKVVLNGKIIAVESFHTYAQLYINEIFSLADSLPMRIDHGDDTWKISATVKDEMGDEQFPEVSFINNINTINGGTHVDGIVDQIVDYIRRQNAKKEVGMSLDVKKRLWLFVSASIKNGDNLEFDDAMETLKTKVDCCVLPESFLEHVVTLLSSSSPSFFSGPKKTIEIPHLRDALEAGGRNSVKCTLILVEGESAINNIRDAIGNPAYFGLFPVEGKLPNALKLDKSKMSTHGLFKHLEMILGLKDKEKYDNEESVNSLRYGHLMIIADQGLGGHRTETLICHFKSLNERIKNIIFMDEEDANMIDLAFGGKAEERTKRRNWLEEEEGDFHKIEVGHSLDQEHRIKIGHFINTDLKKYFWESIIRGIPSLYDGLKTAQRKILFVALKEFTNHRNDELTGLFSLSASVLKLTSYRHSQKSCTDAITYMAQDFVGTNNINLLIGVGNFGSRCKGRSSGGEPRYNQTKLSKVTRYIFPEVDDVLMEYSIEYGKPVPSTLLPIIPIVLVNGSNGIAAGFSTNIPSFDPLDIIRHIRCSLKKAQEELEPLKPFFKGFRGTVELDKGKFYTTGVLDYKECKSRGGRVYVTLQVTELPIDVWTCDYMKHLDKLVKDGFIETHADESLCNTISITVTMRQEKYEIAKQNGSLYTKFKLKKPLSLDNMRLYDEKHNTVVCFTSAKKILDEFISWRLGYYTKRKELLMNRYMGELGKEQTTETFLELAPEDNIEMINAATDEVFADLLMYKFTVNRAMLKPKIRQLKKLDERAIWLQDLSLLETMLSHPDQSGSG